MAVQLAAFHKALGLFQVAALGFSLGGIVAWAPALEAPILVSTVREAGRAWRSEPGACRRSSPQRTTRRTLSAARAFRAIATGLNAGQAAPKRLRLRVLDQDPQASAEGAPVHPQTLTKWDTPLKTRDTHLEPSLANLTVDTDGGCQPSTAGRCRWIAGNTGRIDVPAPGGQADLHGGPPARTRSGR